MNMALTENEIRGIAEIYLDIFGEIIIIMAFCIFGNLK